MTTVPAMDKELGPGPALGPGPLAPGNISECHNLGVGRACLIIPERQGFAGRRGEGIVLIYAGIPHILSLSA